MDRYFDFKTFYDVVDYIKENSIYTYKQLVDGLRKDGKTACLRFATGEGFQQVVAYLGEQPLVVVRSRKD